MVPSVAVIGAMKSGTTYLASLLQGHPDICVAAPKEPGFFSRDERYSKGWSWYLDHFKHARPGQYLLDGSTCYSRSVLYPMAAPRLAAAAPGVRLIYILRHPVERAYSHYCHDMQYRFVQGLPIISPEQFVESNAECISASEYARELRHLYKWFSPEQILCLRFEAITNTQNAVLAEVADFCGLDTQVEPQNLQHLTRNSRGEVIRGARIQQRLEHLRSYKVTRWLVRWVPASLRASIRLQVVNTAYRLRMGHNYTDEFLSQLPRLSPEFRQFLHDRLDSHTADLECVLGWNINSWLSAK